MRDITFANFDKFKRREFAGRLTMALTKFSPFQNEAYVLGLNARFGSGKTTFLEMWKNELEQGGHKVVYINAWETDFDNEPLVPILSSLLETINGRQVKLKSALQGVLGATALASSQLAEHITGISSEDIVGRFKGEMNQENLQKLGQEIYKEYDFKQKAYQALKSKLGEYVGSLRDNKLLIILVDELDRARPDYSVRFLEAIKHIFPIKGICFVLAIDRQQLEISVKQLYGAIDFENYYRRFITHEANLPEANSLDLKPFLQALAAEFIDTKKQSGINFPFPSESMPGIIESMAIICKAFNFAPRQIESLFRIFSQLMAVSSDDKVKLNWVRASIFLIALLIYKPELYNKVGQGSLTPSQLRDFIKSLNFSSDNEHYEKRNADHLISMALSFYMEENNAEEIGDILRDPEDPSGDINSIKRQRQEVIQRLARSIDEYSSSAERNAAFKHIYKLIEDWKTFLE